MGSGSSKSSSPSNSAPKSRAQNNNTVKPAQPNNNKKQANNNNKKGAQKQEQQPVIVGDDLDKIFLKFEETNAGQSSTLEIPKCPDYFTEVETKWDIEQNANDSAEILSKEILPGNKNKSDDEGKVKGNNATWVSRRKKEIQYEMPSGGCIEKVVEMCAVLEPKSKKRDIVVFGGTLFGNDAISKSEACMKVCMEELLKVAVEEIHTVVLLGDMIEMWIDHFQSESSDLQNVDQLMSRCKTQLCDYFVACVQKLTNECGVKVLYLRGNHDHDLAVSVVERLFGDSVTFLGGTVVYRLDDEGKEYRIRFSHGHEFDIFSSYALGEKENLLCTKPIGHYISRAMASVNGAKMGIVEKQIQEYTSAFLEEVSLGLESCLVKALCLPQNQERFMSNLFCKALGCSSANEDVQCVVEDGKYVTLKSMMSYPFIQLLCNQFEEEHILHMLKAAAGDCRWFAKQCQEDVVVLGHGTDSQLRTYKANNGNDVIYANCGSWANGKELSMVRICPPTKNVKNGKVYIDTKIPSESAPRKQETPVITTQQNTNEDLGVEEL